jgi:hypothetical protein
MLSRLQQPHKLFTTDAQVKRSFHCRNNTERRMDTVEVSSVQCLPPRFPFPANLLHFLSISRGFTTKVPI